MRKWIKVIGLIIAIIVILFIVLITALLLFVDPNHFKPIIIKQVQEKTGRTLSIPGKISWSFFPNIGLSIGETTLSNPKGFGTDTFLSVDHAKISIALLPLFTGHIAPKEIELQGLHVDLIQKAPGNTNWQFTTPVVVPVASSTKPVAAQPATPVKAAPAASHHFSLDSIPNVSITHAVISFHNLQTGQQVVISDFNTEIQDASLFHPFPIKASLTFTANQPELQSHAQFNATVRASLKQQRIELHNLDLISDITTHNKTLPISVKGDVMLNLQAQTIAIKATQIKIANALITGDMQGDHLLQNVHLQGTLKTNVFNLAQFLQTLQLPSPHFPNPNALSQAQASLQWTATPDAITLSHIDAKLDHSHLQGQLSIQNLQKKPPTLALQLQINQINFSDYLLNGSGTAHFNTQLTTQGNTVLDLKRHLNGSAQFAAINGVLKGIDVAYYVQIARALLQHQAVPAQHGANETTFGNLSGTLTIQNGIGHNPDLLLTNPTFRVQGEGDLNFVDNVYENYYLNVSDTHTTFPLRLEGNLNQPRLGVDERALLKMMGDSLKDQLQENVKQMLQGNGQKNNLLNQFGF